MTNFKHIEKLSTIRIVTKPYVHSIHWISNRIIPCALDDCPACEIPNRPSRKWMVGVIDRDTNSYCIAKFGSTTMIRLKELASEEGNLENYDLAIQLTKMGSHFNRVDFQAREGWRLTEHECSRIPEDALEELARLSRPPSPEKVQRLLDSIN